jgi:hypothetical protein
MKKVILSLVAVVVITVSAVVTTSCSETQAQTQGNNNAKQVQWEYKIVERNSGYLHIDGEMQMQEDGYVRFSYRILNSLGKEGWELVASNTTQHSERYAFKRRLP